MYIPKHFGVGDTFTEDLLRSHGAADLVTATSVGLLATRLPFVYDAGVGEHGALLGHIARGNDQWRHQPNAEALVIIHGAGDAYISPSWYAAKATHGRVVPTWNYVTAHVYGRLTVHDEEAWTDMVVRRLTDKHEAIMSRPWTVDEAPKGYVRAQLKAIVGIEVRISRVEAKAKLSQNQSAADRNRVACGLAQMGDTTTAEAVRSAPTTP